jgi:pimeloyl-ACP methyl ester carboxylesterase
VRSRIFAVIGFTAFLTASACSGNELHGSITPVSTKPSTTPSGWTVPTINWNDSEDGSEFQCGDLEVPLDWNKPEGETVQLRVARHQASGKRVGTLFTNPGGPGGSGIGFVTAMPFSPAVTQRFDLVSWDPRGVGESEDLQCGGDRAKKFLQQDPDPDTPEEQIALDVAAKAVAEDCAAHDQPLIQHIGTDDVARDMEAIRLALGGEPVNYLGFSYGTLIGLRYLDLFPKSVRTMVLDGVVDPTLDFSGWLEQQTVAIDASLNRVFAASENDAGCPVDDLAAEYDRLRAQVESAPISTDAGTLGPAELATGAIYISYDPDSWSRLATAVQKALNGDGKAMYGLAQEYYDFGGYTSYAAVECVDSPHPVGSEEFQTFAKRLEALSPRFGGAVANELLPCAFWPVAPTPINGPVVAAGAPPVLVLGNRGDAATPYQNSVKVAETLEKATLVSYAGEGHTSYGRSTCVDDVVDEYLISAVSPAKDPDCQG